jgi:hypothetical protein
MIEYAIYSLRFQARGIADLVPNPQATKELLTEAADLLDRAAGERHSARGSGEMDLHDDTPEAQREQLDLVEKHLAEAGVGAAINAAPLREPRFHAPPEDRQLSALTEGELFAIWGNVMRTLKYRGVVRSTNRPLVGDYAETLAARALGAKRPSGPDRGVDLEAGGRRFQVKARLDPPGGTASHFDIAHLKDRHFDVFVGFVFGEDFLVRDAWEVDWEVLDALAVPAGSKHRVKIRALEENYRAGGGVRQLEL